jgi:uncharacterized protein RhaS with RHS repeats
MQQRYYDPVIGRFYSNDPVDFMGHMKDGNLTSGFNRYAYANNNPYKYIDPDGRLAEQIDIKIEMKIDVEFKGETYTVSSTMTGQAETLSSEQLGNATTMRNGVEVVNDSGKTLLVMGDLGVDFSTINVDAQTVSSPSTGELKEGESKA